MNRFEQLRYEKGLTQAELARQAGISRPTVMRLEGLANPKPTQAVANKLADFYGIKVAELLGLPEPSDRSVA